MNESFDNAIQSQLAPNEKLLWTGQPAKGLRLRAADALLIPFSIMWGGFAIFWEMTVLNTNAPGFFALWGIPFVLVGLYLMIGRFFVDAAQRNNTVYAVTSERVIIASGILWPSTKSLSIDTLSDVSLNEHWDGKGTITFGPVPMWNSWQRGSAWPGSTAKLVPSFELIDDPRRVFDLIRNAQRAAKGLPS